MLKISTEPKSAPLMPMRTSPPSTSRLVSLPPVITGLPVVSVTCGVLKKLQPLQVIPLGLATITSADVPATSVAPSSNERDVPVTSLRITEAGPEFCKFAFP